MMIKDLCKEIDGQAVRGGLQDNGQANYAGGAVAVGSNSGIAGTVLALSASTQTNLNAPTFTNQPVAVGIAGYAFAI